MSTKPVSLRDDELRRRVSLGGSFSRPAVVFLFACLVLFLGMPLRPNAYDEGIMLVAAMRVAAGQIPHRDFYAIYGPGQFYILAGLFKLFGQTILVERIVDLIFRSLVVATVYAIASSYFRKSIALASSLLTLTWLVGLYYNTAGFATIPVSFFNLVSTAIVAAVYTRVVPAWRMAASGAIAGLSALFRYDTGIALLCIHICIVAIGACAQVRGSKVRAFGSAIGPYLFGFAIITLPPLIYYLSVAPIHSFLHDIFLFPSQYYYRARNLPFPTISLRGLHHFAVYLPFASVGISAYALLFGPLSSRGSQQTARMSLDKRELRGFLIAFSFLTVAMYCKAFVRMSVPHMYLATIPSLLLTAALFQWRLTFLRPARILVYILATLSILSPVWCALAELRDLHLWHASMPEKLWSAARGTTPAIRKEWCAIKNPATRGLCFFPEDDRIQAIEFVASHTRPDQALFLGVPGHDTIFANDNLTYFATQRMPATRWSEFDADLQNRYDIQVQIIHELETNTPPYVVLDSEFQEIHEPNDSSKSSGVTLLDDYLHKKYRHIKTFGDQAIWQRV